jgi:hypothetical protein
VCTIVLKTDYKKRFSTVRLICGSGPDLELVLKSPDSGKSGSAAQVCVVSTEGVANGISLDS